MKRIRRSVNRRSLVGLAACVALTGPAAAIASAKTIIAMSGSTSIFPLAEQLATQYVQNNNVGFRILQGGSDVGIDDVAHGRVTIGNSSRDPIPGVDPGGLFFNKIARDGICVITNPSNRLGGLDQGQVQAIFSGQVHNWRRVRGAHVRGSIDLITRTAASGTADAFQNIFMGPNHRVAGSAREKLSNGLVNQAVRSDPNAIGFVSFDFIGGVSATPYEGVPCTLRNAKSGQYNGVRNFWMVTLGPPTGDAGSFIHWVQHSGSARSIINQHWIALG